MKQILVAALISFSLLFSCKQENKDETTTTSPVKPTTTNCYRFANQQDTILLTVKNKSDSVTGSLLYQLHEKDKNTGTIQGVMQGDLLVADYTFRSEGITSVRQVVFKKAGNEMIEGYGEIKQQGDRQYFKNINSLRFNNDFKLSLIECR